MKHWKLSVGRLDVCKLGECFILENVTTQDIEFLPVNFFYQDACKYSVEILSGIAKNLSKLMQAKRKKSDINFQDISPSSDANAKMREIAAANREMY